MAKAKGGAFNRLTPEEERIILYKGTEAPFSGEYDKHFEPGVYVCRRCNAPLYRSSDKFDAGCGWPSFDDEIKGAVKRIPDADGVRTEIQCANCGAHLGHVFEGEHMTDKNVRHCVNSISLKFMPDKKKDDYVVLGGGCFWCTEAVFSKMKGVLAVTSGYSGGSSENPTYEEISTGKTGHVEVAKVEYDAQLVPFEKILEVFFLAHDPTSVDKQGNDTGSQYRSVIFCITDEQKKKAEEFIRRIQKNYPKPIVTEVRMLDKFYPAEDYHKNFFVNNPLHPYSLFVIRPKLEKLKGKI